MLAQCCHSSPSFLILTNCLFFDVVYYAISILIRILLVVSLEAFLFKQLVNASAALDNKT